MNHSIRRLNRKLEGEIREDRLTKTLYATDASVYREIPQAVAFPKSTSDIQKLIEYAKEHKTSLIPRTAGTSLAGQCVGDGIVVDVSKYFTHISESSQNRKPIPKNPSSQIMDSIYYFTSIDTHNPLK